MKDIEKYKEIFNSPLVEAIERELIWIGHDCERVGGEQYKEAVRSLLLSLIHISEPTRPY